MIGAVMFFMAGIVLRSTDALDWLHEWFHRVVGISHGLEVVRRELSFTTFAGGTVPQIVWAVGYLGEALIYTMLGIIVALLPMWPAAGFIVGVLGVIVVVVPGSTDMAHADEAWMFGIEAASLTGIVSTIIIMIAQWRKEHGKSTDVLRDPGR